MTKLTDKQKSKIATGAAAVAGVGAGVAGAMFIPTDAEAAEVDNTDEVPVVDSEPDNSHSGASHSGASHGSAHYAAGHASAPTNEAEVVDHEPANTDNGGQATNVEHEPQVTPEPAPSSGDDNVQVLGYQTVTGEDGSQADIAAVSVNGQTVMLADTTMDGYANIAAADANGNGQIDDGEMVDVTGQGIAMQPFKDGAGEMVETNPEVDHPDVDSDPTLASNGEPDYVNDGNVDDFVS